MCFGNKITRVMESFEAGRSLQKHQKFLHRNKFEKLVKLHLNSKVEYQNFLNSQKNRRSLAPSTVWQLWSDFLNFNCASTN